MADAVIQLRDLQARHAELQASCREKDEELSELRDVAEAATTLQAQDVQTARIIDLSKKNRQLVMQLEKEKTRANKLQADLKAVAAAKPNAALPASAVEGIARQMVEQAAEAAEQANKQADQWKDKYNQQTNKISQLEQKAFTQEIELKKLQRALQREVGDEVPLSKVLDEGSSDWKGRREQILALRNQVQALKAAQGLAPEPRHEVAGKKVLAKVTGSKNAELEQLRAELAAALQDAEAQRTKAEGAISRRKILEAELSGLKEKVSVVLAKTQNDDRLISALRAEVAATKKLQQESKGPARPPVEQDDELWRELGMLRRRCGEQRAQIERYEGTIQQLGDKLAVAQAAAAAAGGTGAQQQQQQPSSSGAAAGGPASPSPMLGRLGSATRAGGAALVASGSSRGGTPPSLRTSASVTDATGGPGGEEAEAGPRSSASWGHGGAASRQGDGGASSSGAGLSRTTSTRGGGGVGGPLTPVEVRGEAVDAQLRLAQVEISRLQELVQLLQQRIQTLEDELADARDGG